MTGISTVVGVIPLVIGSGAGFESRLTIGLVLISGIFFSIILTLLSPHSFLKLLIEIKFLMIFKIAVFKVFIH